MHAATYPSRTFGQLHGLVLPRLDPAEVCFDSMAATFADNMGDEHHASSRTYARRAATVLSAVDTGFGGVRMQSGVLSIGL